jgi:hypothetical protein
VNRTLADKKTKSELVSEIARRIGVRPPLMSTGSTEPRKIFELVISELGLGFETSGLTKPNLAKRICELAGVRWTDATCASTGSTVTREGLLRVLRAVVFLTGGEG